MATQSSASQVISETAKAEGGPTKRSDSAQMQSQVTKQRNAEQATEEVAKKLEDGTVTKEDANYVESRQHKALGHRPEAGSVAAQAQSVADQKENATPNASQDGSQNAGQSGQSRDQRIEQAEHSVPEDLANKVHSDPQHVSHADAAVIMSAEHKALGFRPPKGTLASEAQHLADVNEPRNTTNDNTINNTSRDERIQQAEAAVPRDLADKVHNDPEHITHADANAIESAEHKALGFRPPKGSLAAQAQHLADANDRINSTNGMNAASTNGTNGTTGDTNGRALDPTEQSHRDREANFQAEAAAVKDKIEHDPTHVTGQEANHLHRLEMRAHGNTEKGGITAQAQHLAAQNESTTNDSTNTSSNNNAANNTAPPLANAAQGIQEATAAAESAPKATDAAQGNQS